MFAFHAIRHGWLGIFGVVLFGALFLFSLVWALFLGHGITWIGVLVESIWSLFTRKHKNGS